MPMAQHAGAHQHGAMPVAEGMPADMAAWAWGCCCLGFLSGCPVINASWISSSTRSSAASAGGSAAADARRRRQGGTILCAVAGSHDGPSKCGAIEGVGRPSILRQPLGWAFSAQMATDRHIRRKRDGSHINRNVVAAMPPNVRRAMPLLLVSTGDPQGISLGGHSHQP